MPQKLKLVLVISVKLHIPEGIRTTINDAHYLVETFLKMADFTQLKRTSYFSEEKVY